MAFSAIGGFAISKNENVFAYLYKSPVQRAMTMFAVNISSADPRRSLPGIRRRCPCDPAGYCR